MLSPPMPQIPLGPSLTITWDKSSPYAGFVTISGSSSSATNPQDPTTIVASGFYCTAPYSDGAFTVPAYIMLSMAPSQTISIGTFSYSTGTLSFGITGTPVRFTAPNLDFGFIEAATSSSRIVTYQ